MSIENIPPRHAMSRTWARWVAARVEARWRAARALWEAVRGPLAPPAEYVSDDDLVLVMGPHGRARPMPRGAVKMLGLQQAASLEEARERMGLPPAMTMTIESDHTRGRGM
jgi:hypothetical protein